MKIIYQLVLITVSTLLLALSPAHAETRLYFVHSDHLGVPQAVTDKDQNVVWQGSKKPFGEMENVISTIDQLGRFPGQYLDVESGLFYNYYRDYDPSLGRYIQADPIGVNMDFSDPQMQVVITQGVDLQGGMHLHDPFRLNHSYGYVGQNPMNYTDIFGLAYSPQGEHGIPTYCTKWNQAKYDACIKVTRPWHDDSMCIENSSGGCPSNKEKAMAEAFCIIIANESVDCEDDCEK